MSNRKNLYVDFHVLQTLPPSNVNRDDTGSPKTAIYGGVTRARVSSQAWKRAMRQMFLDNFDESKLGVRTKKIIDMVATEIIKLDGTKSVETASKEAKEILEVAGLKFKDNDSEALFFLGKNQAKNLAQLSIDEKGDKKKVQSVLSNGSAVDIALFGRMVASAPELNTDAASQVAHAISVHSIENEYDYFTAVDDMAPSDNAGAGMIGTVEFNSSTLYRYATIAVHVLNTQLGSANATSEAVKEFARAFITSMPTGKQNTFANRTLPGAVLVTIRTNQPVNLVGAFENPASKESAIKSASEKLATYATDLYSTYSDKPELTLVMTIGETAESFSSLGEKVNIENMLDSLLKNIEVRLSEDE